MLMKKLGLMLLLVAGQALFSQKVGMASNIDPDLWYFNTKKLGKIIPQKEVKTQYNIFNDVVDPLFKEKNIDYRMLPLDFWKIAKLGPSKNVNDGVIATLDKFCEENGVDVLYLFRKVDLYDSFYSQDLFDNLSFNYGVFSIDSYSPKRGLFFSNFHIYKYDRNTKDLTFSVQRKDIDVKLNTFHEQKFDQPIYDVQTKDLINPDFPKFYYDKFKKTIKTELLNLMNNENLGKLYRSS